MDVITIWEPEIWWDGENVGHVLGDALIFLAQSRNPYLWATVLEQYSDPLVELRMSPGREAGWVQPDAYATFYDDWLDQAIQPRDYVEDYLRQVDRGRHNTEIHGWEVAHQSLAWRDCHDVGAALQGTLEDIYGQGRDDLEIWFCLPTPEGQPPYEVRRPSRGHRYEMDQLLAQTRAPED